MRDNLIDTSSDCDSAKLVPVRRKDISDHPAYSWVVFLYLFSGVRQGSPAPHRWHYAADENKRLQIMEPVMFEDYDGFVGENSMIKGSSTVKVLSNDGNISILARDLNSGLIFAILRRCDADSRLRIMYCGKVFRNTSSGIQEIRKLGAEYLGEESSSADLEILEMAMDIMAGMKKTIWSSCSSKTPTS